MQKKKIIIISSFILLLIAAIFTWAKFSGKKTVNIVSQPTENNQAVVSDQPTVKDSQQSDINNQQAVNDKQQNANNTQEDKKPVPIKSQADSGTKSSAGNIVDRFVSWGFKKVDSRSIDTIVIHSNYNTLSDDPYSISGAIEQFKMYGVAAHYIIDRSGTIYQLVSEKNISYHAGVSQMKDGRTDVNNFSIGIELMIKDSKDSPTDAEYKALNSLISGIKKRWPIKYVVGHSDIAPGRKTDPWGFDWSKVNK